MTQPLSFHEFQTLAKKARRIAVFKEIAIDQHTPGEVYAHLRSFYQTEGVVFEDLQDESRQAYLCFDLMATLKIYDKPLLTALRHFQSEHDYITRPDVAERITNSLGFMTYDAIRCFEDIPDSHTSELPLLVMNVYALSLSFDHKQQSLLISVISDVGDDVKEAYLQAQQKINTIIDLIGKKISTYSEKKPKSPLEPIEKDISDADFIQMIKRAKQHIVKGDAFQIVLSRCFKRKYSAEPFDIYTTLAGVSPAPFMFYMPTEFGVFLGASPERLIKIHDQKMTVNPIAGTRKSTPTSIPTEIEAELLTDIKELAEHRMLVDLARNDLGAVAKPGSVQVSELLKVKHYSHISHITSTVTAQLDERYDAFDALIAAFPAGTLSGAPKIRAMQIIDALETSTRGLYGGAIFRLDALGHVESCIAIRMAMLRDGIATIRTGAGIVHDSNPTEEANETLHKAEALLDAFRQAHGEYDVADHR